MESLPKDKLRAEVYERLEGNRRVFYAILEMEDKLKDTYSAVGNKTILFEIIRIAFCEILDAIDEKYGFSTGMVDYLLANYKHPEVEKLYEKGIEFKLRFRPYKDTLRVDMEPVIND